MISIVADDLHEILEYVKALRAIDFSAYRTNTIRRRLALRLRSTGMPDNVSYLKYLRENPGEIDALIDALTIKVSCFFRNPLVFEALGEIVMPGLLDRCKDDVLRVWCAGCARGEEAYSVAMLIKDVAVREALSPKMFIAGTDIDRKALEDARKAVYRADSVSEVKKGLLDKYFSFQDGFYKVTDEIKSTVTFTYHDVTTCMPPKEGIFSDYHLILCRNVLIYFGRGLHEKVLKSFSGFVQSRGYLALGEAETLPTELIGEYEEIIPGIKLFRKK